MWKYQNTDEMYTGRFSDNNELYHYGIPGMKWGHRKAILYQPNGMSKRQKKSDNQSSKKQLSKKQARRRKALKIGAAVAGGALAAYGGYKLGKHIKGKLIEKGREKYKAAQSKEAKSLYEQAQNTLKNRASTGLKSGSVGGRYGQYVYSTSKDGGYRLTYVDGRKQMNKDYLKWAFKKDKRLVKRR